VGLPVADFCINSPPIVVILPSPSHGSKDFNHPHPDPLFHPITSVFGHCACKHFHNSPSQHVRNLPIGSLGPKQFRDSKVPLYIRWLYHHYARQPNLRFFPLRLLPWQSCQTAQRSDPYLPRRGLLSHACRLWRIFSPVN